MDVRHLLVGSTDLADQRSSFSDFGACVDVSAPGEAVIASYAGDWLFPVGGTSFAAPLVAWLISRTPIAPAFDAGLARSALLARRDAAGDIPIESFPRDFFYAPSTVGTRVALERGDRERDGGVERCAAPGRARSDHSSARELPHRR